MFGLSAALQLSIEMKMKCFLGLTIVSLVLFCGVFWLIFRNKRAAGASSTRSTAAGLSKPADVPDWARDVSAWTVGSVGIVHFNGGRVAHGEAWAFKFGPLGDCVVQGNSLRFDRGPATRKAAVVLAVFGALSLPASAVYMLARQRGRRDEP